MADNTYQMEYTGYELNEALDRVMGPDATYADVSAVDATIEDVRKGVRFVGSNRELQVGIFETDTTLSIPGMAADAKATGDEIIDLKNELLENFKNYLPITTTVAIDANDDLDDYLTPGTYSCSSGSITSTLSNLPTGLAATAFMMIVIKTIGDAPVTRRIRQFLFSEYLGSGAAQVKTKVYTRTKVSDSTWTPWVGFASTDELNNLSSVVDLINSFSFVKTPMYYDSNQLGTEYYVNGGCFTDKYLVAAFHKNDYEDYIGIFDPVTCELVDTITPNPFQFTLSQKIGDMTFNPNDNVIILTSKANSVLYVLNADTFSLEDTINLSVNLAEISYDVKRNLYVGIDAVDAYIFDTEFNVLNSFRFEKEATRQTVYSYDGLLWNLTYYSSSYPVVGLQACGLVSVYDYYGTLHKEYLLPSDIGEVQFCATNPNDNLMYFGYTNHYKFELYKTPYLNSFRHDNQYGSYDGLLANYFVNFENSAYNTGTIDVDDTVVSGTIKYQSVFNMITLSMSLTLIDTTNGITIASIKSIIPSFDEYIYFPVTIVRGSLDSSNTFQQGIVELDENGDIKFYSASGTLQLGDKIYGTMCFAYSPFGDES